MTDDPTSAECEGHARVFETHGYYAKAANLYRDAAELASNGSPRDRYLANAAACEAKTKSKERA
jgi:hypothetical protein